MKLIIETAYLSDKKPLSAILLGRAGSGKFRLLQSLEQLDFVFYTVDVTPSLLVEFLNEVAPERKKFLVIEDFTVIEGMGQKTREALVHILKSGIEEGFTRIDHRGFEWRNPTSRRIQFGFISSITMDSYKDFFVSWKKNGFLSRLVPFSFKLASKTLEILQEETAQKIYRAVKSINPKDFIDVKEPLGFEQNSLELFKLLSQWLAESFNAEPIRTQKQLNALSESNSALRASPKITIEDTTEILRLARWINYDFNDI